MENTAIATVTLERLALSKAAVAELAAAANTAREGCGLDAPAFLIVAVPPGQVAEAEDAVTKALEDA